VGVGIGAAAVGAAVIPLTFTTAPHAGIITIRPATKAHATPLPLPLIMIRAAAGQLKILATVLQDDGETRSRICGLKHKIASRWAIQFLIGSDRYRGS
jgi:hypothetical protein